MLQFCASFNCLAVFACIFLTLQFILVWVPAVSFLFLNQILIFVLYAAFFIWHWNYVECRFFHEKLIKLTFWSLDLLIWKMHSLLLWLKLQNYCFYLFRVADLALAMVAALLQAIPRYDALDAYFYWLECFLLLCCLHWTCCSLPCASYKM